MLKIHEVHEVTRKFPALQRKSQQNKNAEGGLIRRLSPPMIHPGCDFDGNFPFLIQAFLHFFLPAAFNRAFSEVPVKAKKMGPTIKPINQKIIVIVLLFLFDLTTESLGETARVASSRANVRSGPGTQYRVIERLKRGDSLDVQEKKGGWVRIRLKGGKKAWIHGTLVSKTSSSASRVSLKKENLRKTTGGREKPPARKTKSPVTKAKSYGGFVPGKIRLTESLGMVKVTGEMTNRSGKDYMAAGFIISFFDAKQRLLGTGDILVDDIPERETRSFTTYVDGVSYPRIHRHRIQFDFAI